MEDTVIPALGKLSAALSKAQAEFAPIPKDKTATVRHKEGGGQHSYKYSDLATIIDAIRPVLAKHELSISSAPKMNGSEFVLITNLLHSSGQYLQAEYPLPGGVKAQEIGAAITYGRRYSICSLLGICAEDDLDGAGIGKGNGKTPAPPITVKDVVKVGLKAAASVAPGTPLLQTTGATTVAPEPMEVTYEEQRDVPDAAVGILATVIAYSKPKPTQTGGNSYGILLAPQNVNEPGSSGIFEGKSPNKDGYFWFNTFSDTVAALFRPVKGKRVIATVERKGNYLNIHDIHEVQR